MDSQTQSDDRNRSCEHQAQAGQQPDSANPDNSRQAEGNAAAASEATSSVMQTGVGTKGSHRIGDQSSLGSDVSASKGMGSSSEAGPCSSDRKEGAAREGMPGSFQDASEETRPTFLKLVFSHANSCVIQSSLLASLSSALLGYDVGVTSGALLFITASFTLDHVRQEVFVGILNVFSLVGALLSSRLADLFGRRFAMLTASITFFLGAMVMALAPSYFYLLLGRIITGIGVGFGLTIPPLYIAEIAPPANRGGLVSLGEVSINLGILLGFFTCFILGSVCPPWLAWRLMLGGGSLLAVALGLSVAALPESPRWLIMHGLVGQGNMVLLRTSENEMEAQTRYWEILDAAGLTHSADLSKKGTVSSPPGSPPSFSRQRQTLGGKRESLSVDGEAAWGTSSHTGEVVKPMEGAGGQGVWKEFMWPTPPVRRMLIVLIGINFFQQATGIDASVYYSTVMYGQAGIKDTNAVLGAVLLLGFVKLFFVLVAVALLDRFGRRPLLLSSAGGMMLSLLAQATVLLLLEKGVAGVGTWSAVLIVLTNCAFVSFFSLGLGPINWLLTAEIFPLRLRAQAIGIGSAVNRTVAGILTLSFLSLEDATGPSVPFFFFAGMCLLALVFFFFFAPETKGKSLEQIAKMFERPNYATS